MVSWCGVMNFILPCRWYSVVTSNEFVYALGTASCNRNLEKVKTM
jgi:hypothetical protein